MMWWTRQERITLTVLGVLALAAMAVLFGQRDRAPLTLVASPQAATWDAQLAVARTVDLNAADATALQRLPRIGPKLAERIVAYRSRHGRFQTLQELERIDGIGPATRQAIADYVTVR